MIKLILISVIFASNLVAQSISKPPSLSITNLRDGDRVVLQGPNGKLFNRRVKMFKQFSKKYLVSNMNHVNIHEATFKLHCRDRYCFRATFSFGTSDQWWLCHSDSFIYPTCTDKNNAMEFTLWSGKDRATIIEGVTTDAQGYLVVSSHGSNEGHVFVWPALTVGDLTVGVMQMLKTGQSIQSPNGQYQLVMQIDGDLRLYQKSTNKILWASHTNHMGGMAVMQSDGNLVVYNANLTALWASNTAGYPGSRLELRDDGKLVINEHSNRIIWQVPAAKDEL